MSRRRTLSDDEEAVWTGVARSITPLPGRRAAARPTDETAPTKRPTSSSPRHAPRVEPAADKRPPEKKPPALAPLGRRFKQRVSRGRDAIDARLDLHGFTQAEAHAALLRFLQRAQGDGGRVVLVVTGKGSGKGRDDRERGVLKRQVPLWLALPQFRPLVVGFDDAHVGHGGEGALYVRLRRLREPSDR
jgi:DNA-nicking Smr family endonuclease